MMRLSSMDVESRRAGDIETTVFGVIICIVVSLFLAGVVSLYGLVVPFAYTAWVVAFIIFVCAASLAVLVYHGLRSALGHAKVADRMAEQAHNAEIEAKKPAPVLPPAPAQPPASTPAQESSIPTRLASGRAVEVSRETILGFEPDDLLWLCKYLANGGKFTESVMEHLPLPHSGVLMGKAQKGTPYQIFVDACLETGIIVDRGGRDHKSGMLAVTDANEMMRLLKAKAQAGAAKP